MTTVCSSDHALRCLVDAAFTRVEVLIWEGRPVSAKLAAAVDQVRRLPRPSAQVIGDQPSHLAAVPECPSPAPRPPSRRAS